MTFVPTPGFRPMEKFTPPRVVDHSDYFFGQMPLPGMPEAHHRPPIEGITKDHPLYHQFSNPHVWGALAHPDATNPFQYHHDFTGGDGEEIPRGLVSSFAEALDEPKVARMHEAAERVMQHHIDRAQPCIAVNNKAIHGILSSGRVKTQFETGTSNGCLSHATRAEHEQNVYGYPAGHHMPEYENGWFGADDAEEPHPAHARPVYGYLAHDTLGNTQASQYGSHSLVLKKHHLWHRTTACFGDSLGSEDFKRPQPVQAMNVHAFDPDSNMDVSWTDSDEDQARSHLRAYRSQHVDHTAPYTEAQYHGGVGLHDIHYAVLRGAAYHEGIPELKAALNAHKIPWVHVTGSGFGSSAPIDHNFHEALLRRSMAYQASLVAAEEGTMGAPKVVATRGDGIYLLDLGGDQGQIANTQTGILYPPQNIHAIVARGYWEPVQDVEAADILHLVKPQ